MRRPRMGGVSIVVVRGIRDGKQGQWPAVEVGIQATVLLVDEPDEAPQGRRGSTKGKGRGGKRLCPLRQRAELVRHSTMSAMDVSGIKTGDTGNLPLLGGLSSAATAGACASPCVRPVAPTYGLPPPHEPCPMPPVRHWHSRTHPTLRRTIPLPPSPRQAPTTRTPPAASSPSTGTCGSAAARSTRWWSGPSPRQHPCCWVGGTWRGTGDGGEGSCVRT